MPEGLGPREPLRHAAERVDGGGGAAPVDESPPRLWPRAARPTDDAEDEWPFLLEATVVSGRLEISSANEAFISLLGATPDDGRHPRPWQLFVPEAELPHIEELATRSIDGQAWSDWIRVTTRRGDQFILEARAETTTLDDGTRKVHFWFQDISELASALVLLTEHESRLRLLMAELPLIVWTSNHDLKITSLRGSPLVRDAVEGRELTGSSIGALFDTGDDDLPCAAERSALNGERAAYEVEWRGKRFRCSVEPRADLFGRITGTIGTAILEGTASAAATTSSAEVELRRSATSSDRSDEKIAIGAILIDPARFVATKNGRELPLTVTEFRLLVEFGTNPGRVLTRDELVERVWGYGFGTGTAMLTMAVKRLRSKIEDDPARPKMIETVRGIGYRLAAISA